MTARLECPLCHSLISQSQYLSAIGVWREREKFKAALKERLAAAGKAREAAKLLKTQLLKDFSKKVEAIRFKNRQETEKRVAKLTKLMEARAEAADRRESRAAAERQRLLKAIEHLRLEASRAERRGEARSAAQNRRLVSQLQVRIAHSEAASRRAEWENSRLRRDIRRQIKIAERAATEKGKAEVRKANEKVLKTVKAKDAKIDELSRQVKELHHQIELGVTQQAEGLNFERSLVAELRARFRDDVVQPFGKGGDILLTVRVGEKAVGSILFECKKTEKWSNSFLKQVKRDMAVRRADYGVVVTFALPKKAGGFLVRSGVSFVHPYGALHLADTLRSTLIELNRAKLSPSGLQGRLKELMDYVRGNRFRGSIRQVIGETEDLVSAMKREMQDHKRFWSERYSRYENIFNASARMRNETIEILNGKQEARDGARAELVDGFVPMPALTYEK